MKANDEAPFVALQSGARISAGRAARGAIAFRISSIIAALLPRRGLAAQPDDDGALAARRPRWRASRRGGLPLPHASSLGRGRHGFAAGRGLLRGRAQRVLRSADDPEDARVSRQPLGDAIAAGVAPGRSARHRLLDTLHGRRVGRGVTLGVRLLADCLDLALQLGKRRLCHRSAPLLPVSHLGLPRL